MANESINDGPAPGREASPAAAGADRGKEAGADNRADSQQSDTGGPDFGFS